MAVAPHSLSDAPLPKVLPPRKLLLFQYLPPFICRLSIAASMEDVELFLAPLTARSKIREVIRGLVATRQVHTISLGHAPHFYVAGTLPEFEPVSAMYASSSMPASAYFLRSFERDEEAPSPAISLPFAHKPAAIIPQPPASSPAPAVEQTSAEHHVPRTPVRRPSTNGTSESARPHFSRPASNGHDRKPAGSTRSGQPATERTPCAQKLRRTARFQSGRPRLIVTVWLLGSSRTQNGSRSAAAKRWGGAKNGKSNGNHASAHGTNGTATKDRLLSRLRHQRCTSERHIDRPRMGQEERKRQERKTCLPSPPRPARTLGPRPAKAAPPLTAAGRNGTTAKRFLNSRSKQGTKKRG